MSIPNRLRRNVALVAILIAAALAPRARATWSVVLTDTATGEVAIASATCINNFDLEFYLPVVRPGIGVAAAQAAVDVSGKNRKLIWDELEKGTGPFQILQLVAAQDLSFQARQIAIVDLLGRVAPHTGSACAAYAGHTTGTIGTITYSIQGNILAGKAVLTQAKAALESAQGDLADRMMALMLAAQAYGGDGRCSCSSAAPTSCGAPPPSFTKSAHVGFMIVARVGDGAGTCSQSTGCATDAYYMDLNVTQTPAGVDPVFVLQNDFVAWRASWVGHADHLKTKAWVSAPVFDPQGAGSIAITLRDHTGKPTGKAGATVTVTQEDGPTGFFTAAPALDLGNGSYAVPLLLGGVAGTATCRVTVDDGKGPVTLYPFTTLRTAPKDGLSSPIGALSAAGGGAIPLTFQGGPALGARPFLTLVSLSGTQPGFDVGAVHVPLVFDAATQLSIALCGSAVLPGSCGTLDPAGAAAMSTTFPPGTLAPLVGSSIAFSLITANPVDYASDAVSIAITP